MGTGEEVENIAFLWWFGEGGARGGSGGCTQ